MAAAAPTFLFALWQDNDTCPGRKIANRRSPHGEMPVSVFENARQSFRLLRNIFLSIGPHTTLAPVASVNSILPSESWPTERTCFHNAEIPKPRTASAPPAGSMGAATPFNIGSDPQAPAPKANATPSESTPASFQRNNGMPVRLGQQFGWHQNPSSTNRPYREKPATQAALDVASRSGEPEPKPVFGQVPPNGRWLERRRHLQFDGRRMLRINFARKDPPPSQHPRKADHEGGTDAPENNGPGILFQLLAAFIAEG